MQITIEKKSDQNWMEQYNELHQWVKKHHHYPPKHTLLYNWVRYNVKLRNKGKLAQWKVELFDAVDAMRTHEHTGGRKKKVI